MDNIEIAIGKLTGLVEATRSDVSELKNKFDNTTQTLNDLNICFNVFKTHGATCQREFAQINDKLARDYNTLNDLKTEQVKIKNITEYKTQFSGKFRALIGTIAIICGLLVSCNQLMSIKNKINISPVQADTLVINNFK